MKESGKKSKRASTDGGGAMVRLKPETPATATAVSQGSGKASKIWEDSRFAHLVNDPRFRGLPKSEKKVKIDSRFKSMFQDERFQVKATVDKYGRPLRRADTDELKKFYELDEDEEEDEEELQREREREERAMEGRGKEVDEEQEKSDGESDSSDDDDDDDGLQLTEEEKRMVLSEKIKNRLKDLDVDYARGEAQLYSEDEEDDEDDEEDDEEEDEVFIEHVWGELDADVERTEDSTNRLAVCHMDWDRIRAVDIMVLLSSFLPPGCSIKSVKIYPSEFGKERMQEEEERGPQELTVRTVDGSDEEEEDEEQQKERLREYQLNRLKYYYAVVECDSVETADKIYKECDGVEYESTANKLDLRFIPDEMDFGDDEPKDSCSELPEMGKYVPRIFTTTALNQAKVELTWDENDVERKEFNEKLRDGKWAQMPETELKKYVACSSSSEGEEEEETNGRRKSKKKRSILLIRAPKSDESEEDDDDDDDDDDSDEEAEPRESNKKQDMIAKYKALLSDMKEQEKAEEEEQVGMEFTWKVDDKEESNEADGNESSDRTGSSKLPNDVNPFEKILQKKKEKNKKRKELKKRRKRGELDDDAENGNGSADSESEDDLPYGVDLNDPFFASAFDEKEFGKPQKKQSKSKERDTKSKEEEEREAAEEARRKAELELLLDDGDDNRSHFNLRAIQEREIDLKSVSKSKRRRLLKKSKRQIEEQRNGRADAATAEDDFEIDVEDSRFGAIFSKPEYNIDPTNPAFKKTKGIERIIEHKLKKRRLAENDVREEEVEESGRGVRETKKQKKDVATTMLVKSIKRKIGKSN